MPGRENSLPAFCFQVTIGDIELAFRECSGLGSETEVVENKGAKGIQVYEKTSGRLTWDNITLKRGMTDSIALWNWRKQIQEGNIDSARKNGSIVIYDTQAKTKTATWHIEGAWPSKLSGPTLNATSNDVAVEELVLVHEGCYREK